MKSNTMSDHLQTIRHGKVTVVREILDNQEIYVSVFTEENPRKPVLVLRGNEAMDLSLRFMKACAADFRPMD